MALSLPFKHRPLAAICLCGLLAACGGGGRPADPPTDLVVEPGDGQVTLSWTMTPGVDYWAAFKEGDSASTSDGASQWARTPLGLQNAGKANLISPAVVATYAQCAPTAAIGPLRNDQRYTFAMNARIDGGPGGADTTQSATPRLGGGQWISQPIATGAAPTMRAVTYGVYNNTSAKLITPYYLGVGDNNAIYTGALTTSPTGAGGSDIYLTWAAIDWAAIKANLNQTADVDFKAAVFSNNRQRFVIAGSGGMVYSSQDLNTWSVGNANTLSTQTINAMATDGTTIVAVGNGGTIWRSSDAVSWALSTSGTTENLNSVTRNANGLWVAVGNTGTLLTSTDATTWTAVNTGTTANLHGVTAARMLVDNPTCSPPTTAVYRYVAVGSGGTVLTGTAAGTVLPTWSLVSAKPDTGPDLRAVVSRNQQVYYPNQVVQPARQMLALGADGTVWTSTDGVTWTQQTTNLASTGLTFSGLSYLQGLYLGLGHAGIIYYAH